MLLFIKELFLMATITAAVNVRHTLSDAAATILILIETRLKPVVVQPDKIIPVLLTFTAKPSGIASQTD